MSLWKLIKYGIFNTTFSSISIGSNGTNIELIDNSLEGDYFVYDYKRDGNSTAFLNLGFADNNPLKNYSNIPYSLPVTAFGNEIPTYSSSTDDILRQEDYIVYSSDKDNNLSFPLNISLNDSFYIKTRIKPSLTLGSVIFSIGDIGLRLSKTSYQVELFTAHGKIDKFSLDENNNKKLINNLDKVDYIDYTVSTDIDIKYDEYQEIELSWNSTLNEFKLYKDGVLVNFDKKYREYWTYNKYKPKLVYYQTTKEIPSIDYILDNPMLEIGNTFYSRRFNMPINSIFFEYIRVGNSVTEIDSLSVSGEYQLDVSSYTWNSSLIDEVSSNLVTL